MTTSLVLGLILFIVFFIFQTVFKFSEIILLCIAISFSVILLLLFPYLPNLILFCIGLVLGFIIEVILGLVSRQQYWEQSSLLGVPFWLPVAWGYGFVLITQIGFFIHHIF